MTLLSENPLFEFDSQFNDIVIGTDEAGRGPGAGPVFAAAVYFPKKNEKIISELAKLNDSKKLTEKTREALFDVIKANSIYSIQVSTVEEIEKMNILQASLNAMKKACLEVINKVGAENVQLLIDGNKLIPNFRYSQSFIIKGDSKSASIAAASILAKVERDRFMKNLSVQFPQYNWQKNKGYLTKEHLEAIEKYGKTEWHREKFLRKFFASKKGADAVNQKQEQLTMF